jgi:hypothetical protein
VSRKEKRFHVCNLLIINKQYARNVTKDINWTPLKVNATSEKEDVLEEVQPIAHVSNASPVIRLIEVRGIV